MALSSILALLGCQRSRGAATTNSESPAEPDGVPMTPFEPSGSLQVSTDIDRLRAMLQLPAGVTSCRWVEQRIGNGVLGPSDFFVTAYVELSPAGWKELEGVAGGLAVKDPAPGSTPFNARLVRALLPSRIATASAESDKTVMIPSEALPTHFIQSNSTLNVNSVRRVGDGLWIRLATR
jgi:hypothetical protein